VLFGSGFAREKFEEHLRLPHVGVVDYGVDISAYSGEPPPPLPHVPSPYLLCVGEVKERKGYEISMPCFIQAATRAPDLTFAVVGKFREEDPYYGRLVRLLDEAGLRDRVLFLGNVSEEEKYALYAHCTAFILTPKESAEGGFEALGLVFLEAGACGVPVIGTYDSGAVCAIEHGRNGFLIAADKPEEGAEALLKILEDPGLKRRLGEEGRRMAEAREWVRVGEKLERIYTQLVAGERPVLG
jgi:phosphatidylinositol alpha-1,6-mannosyltransferase